MAHASETDRYRALDRFSSLPAAILAARREHGSGRVAFEDIEGNTLTYGQLALAGAVLERALRARSRPGAAGTSRPMRSPGRDRARSARSSTAPARASWP